MQQFTGANKMRDEYPYRPDPELHRIQTPIPDVESPAYWRRNIAPKDFPGRELLEFDYADLLLKDITHAVSAWCRKNDPLSYKPFRAYQKH